MACDSEMVVMGSGMRGRRLNLCQVGHSLGMKAKVFPPDGIQVVQLSESIRAGRNSGGEHLTLTCC